MNQKEDFWTALQEIRADIKDVLRMQAETTGQLREHGVHLSHGQEQIRRIDDRLGRLEETAVTAKDCEERHEGRRDTRMWMVQIAATILSMTAAWVTFWFSRNAKASTGDNGIMEEFFNNVMRLSTGMYAVMAGSVAALVLEVLKGFWPGFAQVGKARKRAISIVAGMAAGFALSFVPESGVSWYAGLIAGLLGSAGASLTRWVGKEGPARTGMFLLFVAAGMVFAGAGCGSTFTAKAADRPDVRMHVTRPAWAAFRIGGTDVCRMNVPEGSLRIRNVCSDGEIPWYADGNVVTCMKNPCATGQTFVFGNDAAVSCAVGGGSK